MVQAVIATTVVGLQGRPLVNTAPTNGQALAYNGTAWAPAGPFLPLAGGTLAGALTIAAGSTANRVFNVQGVIDGSNPPAGMVGEYVQGNGGPFTIAHATWASPVSASLQPGDWDVWGLITISPTTANITQFLCAVGTTANGFGPATVIVSGIDMSTEAIAAVPVRFNLSAQTVIYLNGYHFAADGATQAQYTGAIYARRRR